MTDEKTPKNRYRLDDPALIRGLTQPRISRRGMLAAGAMGMAAMAMPRFARADSGAKPTPLDAKWEKWWKEQKPTKELVFANWPYYMDVTDDGKDHPSLDEFTKQSGIDVKYLEVIQDNASFYAKIAPVLKSGQPIGNDLIVMTNGWQLTELLMQDFMIPLWQEKIPNFFKNASPSVISPSYDKDNKHSIVWQSGMTGIAYNPKLTGREITSFEDLFDPKFAGHIGMFTDLSELGSAGLLMAGIDPTTSTPDDWKKAAAKLEEQKKKGLVRQYYDQSYITALENGDIWLTQAWSGDVFQANAKGFKDLKFIIPKEGGMIWHDNMMIPKGAKNPLSALEYMNYYYTPEAAGTIEDYINYICPVPAAQAFIKDQLKDPDVADSELVFPSDEMYAKVHEFYAYKSYDDYQLWQSTFSPIVQG
ncbi:polyamine ABC transporter substrate-binding protein [Acidimangrovimonas sediminis]|uniref:polyamine ABC transporter substrate-binding protein n=1 Tax=Acidimangrovimonas sediminis TaxID=2056283 RepID=UPI000C7FA8A4|nr:spermidine/putrescine ABC transporter substrate-binding protein [Acidimangrovimonas sediminis]